MAASNLTHTHIYLYVCTKDNNYKEEKKILKLKTNIQRLLRPPSRRLLDEETERKTFLKSACLKTKKKKVQSLTSYQMNRVKRSN